ncbi:Ger(x)C family spore germination protein [Desulfosporosinus nitroreducens]|uniref:Ger(x)C family spore germination protein n=1 Tax=Desulfosporosinus nitroreducens TaxID=2018668 RepID=UPI00207D6B0D|nr:Ger(x)C family spore germination protein [Desulfosporosinus nitroreducens]MCO1603277.1 Ger(x)C family spore germination protein [Desulfosporosinus nitroreducens]
MKGLIKIIVTPLIIIILTLGTTGCWNRRELPALGIVMGVGIDKAEGTDKLEITTQIIKTSELKSSTPEEGGAGSSSSGGGAYWNVKNSGESMFSTIRGFTHRTSRKLYFPHNQIIIFGQSLAKQGIQEYLDFLLRDQETRLEVLMLVAEDKSSDILSVKSHLEKIPSVGVSDLMDSQAANSQTIVIRLNQFVTRIMSPTTAPIAPIISIKGKADNKELEVSGTAVFKRDKLIGQMNKEETRGLLWVINEVKSGIIDIECPDQEGTVSLEIINAKSKITSEIINNKPYIKIDVKEEGNIGDQSCTASLVSPDAVAALEEKKNEAIKDEIESALSKAKKLNADVFGFGEVIHKKHPKEWEEMKDDWDKIFPDLEVEILVKAKLRRSGNLGPPAAPPEKE